MRQKVNGERSVSLATRIFIVSCLFLLASVFYASYSNAKKSSYVFAESNVTSSDFKPLRIDLPDFAQPPVTAPAVVDNSAKDSQELNGEIAAWAAAQPDTNQWGIAVKGLSGTKLEASYSGDTVFETASIFKLFLIYGLSQKLPQDQWSTTVVEGNRTIQDCIKAMLERSDNACGVAVGDKIGWSKIQTTLKAAGYLHTDLNHSPLTSTPNDTLKFLDDLYSSRTFSPQLRDEILGDMRNSIFKRGIVAGCTDCSVANKTGDLNGFTHDVAIVSVDGKDFAISIFSKGGSQRQIAAVTTIIQQYIRSH